MHPHRKVRHAATTAIPHDLTITHAENDDWPSWGPACVAQQAALASWLPTIDVNNHMVDDSFSGSRLIKGFEDQPQVAFTSVHE